MMMMMTINKYFENYRHNDRQNTRGYRTVNKLIKQHCRVDKC